MQTINQDPSGQSITALRFLKDQPPGLYQSMLVLNRSRVIINVVTPAQTSSLWGSALHKHFFELPFSKTMLAGLEKKFDQVEKKQLPQSYSFFAEGQNGKEKYDVKVSGIFNKKNELNGFIVIIENGMLAMQVDDQYHDLFEKYTLAIKAANFGIWEFDYTTGRYYWDETMQQQFGCKIHSVEDFKNLWLKMVEPGDYEGLLAAYKTSRKTGSPFHYIFSVQVNGSLKYIECFAAFKFNPATQRSDKVTGLSLDITERKLATIALRQSEEYYRMLADNSSDIITLYGPDGDVKYMSPSVERATGHTKEDMIAGGLGYIHPNDVEQIKRLSQDIFAGCDSNGPFECRVLHKDGYWKTFEVINKAIRNKQGQLTGLLSASRDVSVRKAAEEQYHILADNATDVIILHQADGAVHYLSPSAQRLLGVTLEDAQQKGGLFYVHPADVAAVNQHNKATFDGKENGQPYECRLRHNDGHWVPFEIINKAVTDSHGHVIAILSSMRDVTARKAAEGYYRLLAENITDAVGVLGLDGKFEYVSPSIERLLGYTPQDAIGQDPFAIIHPDDVLPLKQNTIDKNIAGQDGFYSGYRVMHKNGHWVYFEAASKPVYDTDGNLTNIIKSSRDITARFLAEQAHAASENKYKLLADNMADLIILMSPDFKRLYVSPSCYALTGYTVEEFLLTSIYGIVHPVDQAVFFKTLNETIYSGEGQVVLCTRIIQKNGDIVFVEAVMKAIRNEKGEITNILSAIRNINKQQAAENALRESEKQYRMLADNISDLVVLFSPAMQRLYVSPSAVPLIGYTPEELMTIKQGISIIHPDDVQHVREVSAKNMAAGNYVFKCDFRGLHKNGNIVYFSTVFTIIHDDKGNVQNVLSVARDITSEMLAGIALKESGEKYRMLADNMSDLLILSSPDFKRLYVSPSSFRVLGYTPAEMLLESTMSLIHPDDKDNVIQMVKSRMADGSSYFNYHLRIMHKNGSVVYVSSEGTIIRDQMNNVQNILYAIRNITDETKARAALVESENKYRSLVEASENIILMMDENGTYLFANSLACHYVQSRVEDVLGKTIYDFFDHATADFYVAHIKDVIKYGKPLLFENEIAAAGKKVWLRNTLSPIYNADGRIYAVMLSLVDFTDLRAQTEKLRLQNEELKKIAYLQSHIVRAPLANIEGIINLMNAGEMSVANRQLLELLRKSALQLDGVVTDIVEKAIDVKHKTSN